MSLSLANTHSQNRSFLMQRKLKKIKTKTKSTKQPLQLCSLLELLQPVMEKHIADRTVKNRRFHGKLIYFKQLFDNVYWGMALLLCELTQWAT